MLTVSAEFVPVPTKRGRVVVPAHLRQAAHVRIDVRRWHAALLSTTPEVEQEQGDLIDNGIAYAPCEVDLKLSELLDRLAERRAFGFDYFVEPLEPQRLRLDVDVRRSVDGEKWKSQTVVRDCRVGMTCSETIDEAFGEKLTLRMRVEALGRPRARVRVWLRNP